MNNVIGVVGMAVMGKNLAFNLAEHGYKTAVYNRSADLTDEAKKEVEDNNESFASNLDYYYDLEKFVNSLEKPRKILLLIKAGKPVDYVIDELLKYLDENDIIIDGGNSYFKDTQRRFESLNEKNIKFIGLGVSGGETGARFGPALMPGGDKEAYLSIENLLQSIAAKHEGNPCCKYTSKGGAGHYVKMVHNGIEYGDMELIAESYYILKKLFKMNNFEISEVFEKWNNGKLKSYLIEITSKILREKDSMTNNDLIDMVLDVSAQKGTGKWTNIEAINLGVDISVIASGLNARYMSMLKKERIRASNILQKSPIHEKTKKSKEKFVDILEDSLYISKIISYAQGFKLLQVAEDAYSWKFDLAEISTIFREGCIIRADFLSKIESAYKKDNNLENLMLDDDFSAILNENIDKLRILISELATLGISAPAFYSALSYFDSYTTANSSANMIQAQRDFFGAHTFERIDRDGSFHHQWEG